MEPIDREHIQRVASQNAVRALHRRAQCGVAGAKEAWAEIEALGALAAEQSAPGSTKPPPEEPEPEE